MNAAEIIDFGSGTNIRLHGTQPIIDKIITTENVCRFKTDTSYSEEKSSDGVDYLVFTCIPLAPNVVVQGENSL